MLLTRLGVSLGEFECFPRHVSYQTPSNLSSSSPQPPSPGSSDCKPQVTHPMSFICLHTDRAALSHLRKGSGGPLEVPRSLSSIPQIPDLPRSIYLVTPWHCCEQLTTLSTSHTIMYLLSTSSSPRAAKIPVQILLSQTPSSLGSSHCQQDAGQRLPHLCACRPLSCFVRGVHKALVTRSKDSRETPRHILCLEAEEM